MSFPRPTHRAGLLKPFVLHSLTGVRTTHTFTIQVAAPTSPFFFLHLTHALILSSGCVFDFFANQRLSL